MKKVWLRRLSAWMLSLVLCVQVLPNFVRAVEDTQTDGSTQTALTQTAQPDGPQVPAQPDGPQVPAQPDGPEVPAQPDGPEVPAQPDGAQVPAQPDGSDDPAQPDGSDDPAQPVNPDDAPPLDGPAQPGDPAGSPMPALPGPEETAQPGDPAGSPMPALPGPALPKIPLPAVLKASAGKATLPADFFTGVTLGKTIDENTGEVIPFPKGEEVAMNGACALRFDYKIPTDSDMKTGVSYTFDVAGPFQNGEVGFYVTDPEAAGSSVALGSIIIGGKNAGGTITFQTDMEDYLFAGTKGYFYVGVSFDSKKLEQLGSQTVPITAGDLKVDSDPVNFAAPVVSATLELVKNVDFSRTNSGKHEIGWTVTATPKLTTEPELNARIDEALKADRLAALTVVDTLPEGTSYPGGAEARAKTKTGNPLSTEKDFAYDSEQGTLTYTASGDALKAENWPIVITLATQYDPEDLLGSTSQVTYYNTANAQLVLLQYGKDPDTGAVTLEPGDPVQDAVNAKQTSMGITVYAASLKKDSRMSSGNTVTWTITATNSQKMPNPYVVDTLYSDLDPDLSSVKLDGEALGAVPGETPYYTYKGKTLTVYLDPDSTEKQVITFDTRLSGGTSMPYNKAYLYCTDKNGVQRELASGYDYIDLRTNLLGKKGTYHRYDHTIDWTITLRKTAGLDHVVLTDTMDQERVKQHYVPGSMKLLRDGAEVSGFMEPVVMDNTFTIELDKYGYAAGPVYTITYQTELDESENKYWAINLSLNRTAENNVTLRADGFSGTLTTTEYVSVSSNVLKKTSGTYLYDYRTKTATWTITVNENQMKLTNPVVTDTLPAGWEFDGADAVASVKNGKTNVKGWEAAVTTGTNPNDTLTLTLPDMTARGGTYVINVRAHPTNDNLLREEKISVVNTAALTGDEIPGEVRVDSNPRTIGKGMLKKTGTVNGRTATWTVDVNWNLATLPTDENGKITLVDALPPGMTYQDGSAAVSRLQSLNDGPLDPNVFPAYPVKDVDVTYQDRVLTVSFEKDPKAADAAYRLTFKTLLLAGGTYQNTIRYAAETQMDWMTCSSEKIQSAIGGGATTPLVGYGQLSIRKTDANGKAPLAGAVFSVKEKETGTEFGPFTTDGSGTVPALILPFGTYTVEEITAPPGYVLFTPHPTETVTIQKAETATVEVENIKSDRVARLTPEVTKAVVGDGAPEQTFTFDLAAQDGAPMPYPVESAVVTVPAGSEPVAAQFGEILYTAAGTYAYTITEQDGHAENFTYDKKPHTLTVTVADAEDGKLTASALYDGAEDSLTITNPYQKPETPPVDPNLPETPPTDPDTPTPPPTDPDIPVTPITPEEVPDLPQISGNDLPDPDDPDSPDNFVLIDDEGVPLGVYIKTESPAGTHAYILDEEIPLADVPATGDFTALWLTAALLSGGLLAAFWVDARKKRRV